MKDCTITELCDKWKEASRNNSELVNFSTNYTSTVNKFKELLSTWKVPYSIYNDGRIANILTINYNTFVRDKAYYSDNMVTEEIMENYYA